MNATVYILGILLQAVAGLIALFQVRQAPRKLPWLLIAVSSLLVVARRAGMLQETVQSGRELLSVEIFTLFTSLLFFLGVLLMSRMFHSVAREHMALQESERNYHEIFNATNEAIFLHDADTGRILDVNDTTASLFGYDSKEEILALKTGDLSANESPYTATEIRQKIHLALQEGPQTFEWLARRKNGETFWVEVSLRCSRIGEQRRILAVIRDITRRKRAQEALTESERNYHEIFNATNETIILHDAATGRILDVNDTAVRLYGYDSKEEILAGNVGDLSVNEHPYTETEAQRRIHLAAEDCPQVFEWLALKKSGERLCVEVSLRKSQIGGRQCVLAVARDITQRKRVQEALRASESRYRTLFDQTMDGIAIFDTDCNLVDVNESFAKMHGYTPDEIRKMGLCALNSPEKMKRFLNGETQYFEIEHYHKDGRLLMLDAITGQIELDGKQHILSIYRDITKRKQAEEQARLSSMVLDQIQDQVTITDLNGVILYVNRAQEKASGCPKNALIGQKTSVFGENPEQGATQQEIIEKTLQQGIWRGEVVNYSADGSEHIMDCRTQLVNDIYGQPVALCGSATDITERKRVEKKLRESESLHRLLAENSLDMISRHSIDETAQYVVRYVTPSCEALTGYTVAELMGKPAEFLVFPEDRGRVWDQVSHCLENGEPYQVEHRLSRKDGSIIWVEAKGHFIQNESGHPTEIQCSVHNITERKQAEEALRLFKDLVECSSDAVGMSTPEGKHYYQNEAFDRLFGDIGENPPSTVYVDKAIGKQVFDTIMAGGDFKGEVKMFKKDRTILDIFQRAYAIKNPDGCIIGLVGLHTDITERKRAEDTLKKALDDIRTLRGIVPICANCKNIRDDQGYWKQVEVYLQDNTHAEFSHGICPECMKKLYPGFHEE